MLDYANFFSPNDCKKNDKTIGKCFKDEYARKSKSCFCIKKDWW